MRSLLISFATEVILINCRRDVNEIYSETLYWASPAATQLIPTFHCVAERISFKINIIPGFRSTCCFGGIIWSPCLTLYNLDNLKETARRAFSD